MPETPPSMTIKGRVAMLVIVPGFPDLLDVKMNGGDTGSQFSCGDGSDCSIGNFFTQDGTFNIAEASKISGAWLAGFLLMSANVWVMIWPTREYRAPLKTRWLAQETEPTPEQWAAMEAS